MPRHSLLHAIVEPESVLRALALGLLASLLLLADGYVLIVVSRFVGIYLLLAGVGATGLVAFITIGGAYRTEIRSMWRTIDAGTYPRREFRRLVSLLAAAALLIIPGLVSDAAGLLLLIRPMGWLLGAFVESRRRERFQKLYEYLRLSR